MLAIYLLAVIVESGLEVFRVSLVYPIINYGLGVQNQPKLLDAFYDYLLPSSVNPFIASALLLILVTIVIPGFYGIVAYHGAHVFASVRVSLDKRIFNKIANNPYTILQKKNRVIYYISVRGL